MKKAKKAIIQNNTSITLYADVLETDDKTKTTFDITLYSKQPTVCAGQLFIIVPQHQLELEAETQLAPYSVFNKTGYDLSAYEIANHDSIRCVLELAQNEVN